MPERFDVIELTVDLPELGLHASQQGTVVHQHSADEAALLEAIAQADRGEVISGEDLLRDLRREVAQR